MITFAEVVKLLKHLSLYWHGNTWVTYRLWVRREKFKRQIRNVKRGLK